MQPWLLQTADEEDPQPLVGIAKLAAQGESIRQGHLVEYFTLPSRGAAESLHLERSAVHLDDQSVSRLRVRL